MTFCQLLITAHCYLKMLPWEKEGKAYFIYIYIVYEMILLPFKWSVNFTLGNSLFWAVKVTKNADFDKYKYSGYGIGFDARGSFSLSDGSGFAKNVII